MSSVDLIILGILISEPLNAYQINQRIQKKRYRDWLKISEPAVYRNVRCLADKGFLVFQNEKLSRKRPDKKIYSITDQGRAYFKDVTSEMAAAEVHVECSFDALVANSTYLDQQSRLDVLESIRAGIKLKQKNMEFVARDLTQTMPLEQKAVIDLQKRLLKTTGEWVEDLLDFVAGKQFPSY